jgi:chromosome partitioning protein
MKIIGFVNSKGGVGKSTVVCNIAVEVALKGKSPLLIDGDIQGSSTAFRATREIDDIKLLR